jgi:hypothetical protein
MGGAENWRFISDWHWAQIGASIFSFMLAIIVTALAHVEHLNSYVGIIVF